MKKLPILYKQSTTGKIVKWEVHVDGCAVTCTYGQLYGKQQATTELIKGKNIGKSNETTASEQAELKAKQLWDKKVKEGYSPKITDALEGETNLNGVEPMLAYPYEKKIKHAKFPAFAQPKLDGHRCIAVVKNGKCTLYSRTQKEITTVPHINKEIEELYGDENVVLDGELYNHKMKHNFDLLTSIIKGKHNQPHPEHKIMQYHIYDIVSDLPYEKRMNELWETIDEDGSLKLVQTLQIENETDMRNTHDYFTEQGYEGLMYRSMVGGYEHKRSTTLLKVKVFQDEEFEIIGVNEGKGKEAGYAVTFTCKNNKKVAGMEFKATINRLRKGSKIPEKESDYAETKAEYAERCKRILLHPEDYIGKMLTVQFQGRTPDGVPRFGQALRLRQDI